MSNPIFISGIVWGYTEQSANYSVLISDMTVNCTSGSFTVTLPTAVGISGQEFRIKNSGVGVITVATTASQTIDGITTQTLNSGEALYVVSTGTNFIII